jgi:hypothetical protein
MEEQRLGYQITGMSAEGDRGHWNFQYHNVLNGTATAGSGKPNAHHWFALPMPIFKRFDLRVGLIRAPSLRIDWWPRRGLWVVPGAHISVGNVPLDVNSAAIADF